MNFVSRLRHKAASFAGHLIAASVLVCVAGIGPAMAATVTVDQSPLIIQRSLPPNIVLMLDDSGSMDWDYMPDWSYLSSTSDDAVRNASINGAYYNLGVTYTPPVKADGSLYPDSPGLTNAYADGFRDTTGVDVTKYKSPSRTFPYYTVLPITTTSTYAATMTCAAGDVLKTSGGNNGKCRHGSGGWNPTYTYYTPNVPTCNNGDASSGTQCTKTTTTNKYYFTYTTGAGNTRHYVGVTGSCAALSAAQQAVCDDSVATQQNVANWFSYYRKRILLAKSGLMNAFSSLDATFRVGFGSIDGGDSGNNNYTNLPSSRVSYADAYNGGTNYIATVQPFGDGTDANDQKTKFWNWVAKATANGGTPLRQALDAAGSYYKTAQPWRGMSSDPDYDTAAASTQLACRQSYAILTTDGFWNENFSDVGDVDGSSGSVITGSNQQSYAYSPAVPYADGSATSTTDTKPASCSRNYTLKSPDSTHSAYYCYRSFNGSTTEPTCGSGYALSADKGTCSKTTTTVTSYSDTLADVAMKYWRTDLRTDIDNEVPTNAEDPAFWQHMTTFTLGMGFDAKDGAGALLDKARMDQIFAWANGNGGKAISNFSWPKPKGDSINNIADLAHAAVNGHGGFYSAKSPDDFSDGLKDALKRASERVGTGASLAANSTQLQAGMVIYQSNYWTAKWKGDLMALAVAPDTHKISDNASWTASGSLPAAAQRTIRTYNPAADSGQRFVDFAWDSLSKAQQDALLAVQLPSGTTFTPAALLNWLRGDDSQQLSNGGVFRNRDTPLGDIVNSQPVYVGAPDASGFSGESFTGSSAYVGYAGTKRNRAGTVYVAANDGMLHGFDAVTGVENFAYLPGAVITAGVSALASPDYGGSVPHGFFNDGELTVAEVYMGNPASWRTVLVGTTGRGVARAVYALDVTDPANVSLLWERSAGDGLTNSNYIGQMVGKPVIAQTADGVWAVLVGNGYNSAAGKSALLQFALADGGLNVHATTDTSGLAAPAVWMGLPGNGVSTSAYAGDANGNVWSFAVNSNEGSSATATPDSAGVKIFVTRDGNGNPQPITAGMLMGRDPNTGNIWVFFGTGRYLSAADLNNTGVQSWYGLIVQSNTSGLAVGSSMTRGANLAKRTITAEKDSMRTVTTLDQAAEAKEAIDGKSGWYIDLVSPVNGAEGERMVIPNVFYRRLLNGTTRIPKASDPCNPSGKGADMFVEPFTGTNPREAFIDGNGDGVIDASDSIDGTPASGILHESLPNGSIFSNGVMYTSFDDGSRKERDINDPSGTLQRVSWRELIAH